MFDRETKGYIITMEVRVIKRCTLADVAVLIEDQNKALVVGNEEIVMESTVVRVVEINDDDED